MSTLPRQATLVPLPFVPSLSDAQLDHFTKTLANCEIPKPTYFSQQARYGITTEWMQSTLKYWQDEFDWKKREKMMNEVDHFKTTVSGFNIHFVAHYSDDANAIPLLLLHGWPGSWLEYVETIKILKKSKDPAFHLICPSQPGYGFSDDPPLDTPFGMNEVAALMDSLMRGLGFESGYAVQGGDIGSVIARIMAVKYESCRAVNINYMPLLPPKSILPTYLPHSILPVIPTFVSNLFTLVASPILGDPSVHGLTPLEIKNARKGVTFATTGRGYGQMHGTRPGTIGIVVQSSPVALLAWLGEKFRDWTDTPLPLDVILETCTLWYIQQSFPKAIYAYEELTAGVGAWHTDPKLFIWKPLGFSSFACEIASAPKAWAAQTGNLKFYKYYEEGGHFAALERPEIFAESMRDCFRAIYPRD